MSVTTEQKLILGPHVLTAAYTDPGAFGTLRLEGANEFVLYFDYTKGDEAVGLHFKIEWLDAAGTAYAFGEVAANVWTAQADQQINATNKLAVVKALNPGFGIKVSVKANGGFTSAGTVTVRGAGGDGRMT